MSLEMIAENVRGALYPGEGRYLYDLAKKSGGGGVIVEIGSFLGFSTCCLALGSKHGAGARVMAIDPFDGGDTRARSKWIRDLIAEGSFLHIFLENISKVGLRDMIVPIAKRSSEALDDVKEPITLLFIDGAHDYQYVLQDFTLYAPKVSLGGAVAFHDRNRKGVEKVISEHVLKDPSWKVEDTYKSIFVCRRVR